MKKILDYSLIPKEIDINNIKVLKLACSSCGKVASMTISETMDMTQDMMDYMEGELKSWLRSHCRVEHKLIS